MTVFYTCKLKWPKPLREFNSKQSFLTDLVYNSFFMGVQLLLGQGDDAKQGHVEEVRGPPYPEGKRAVRDPKAPTPVKQHTPKRAPPRAWGRHQSTSRLLGPPPYRWRRGLHPCRRGAPWLLRGGHLPGPRPCPW